MVYIPSENKFKVHAGFFLRIGCQIKKCSFYLYSCVSKFPPFFQSICSPPSTQISLSEAENLFSIILVQRYFDETPPLPDTPPIHQSMINTCRLSGVRDPLPSVPVKLYYGTPRRSLSVWPHL